MKAQAAKCSNVKLQLTDRVSVDYSLLLIIYMKTNFELESGVWFSCLMFYLIYEYVKHEYKNHFMNLYTFDVTFIAFNTCVGHIHSSLSLLPFCWIDSQIHVFLIWFENWEKTHFCFVFALQNHIMQYYTINLLFSIRFFKNRRRINCIAIQEKQTLDQCRSNWFEMAII